ncbi:hypothetical protein BGX26_000736, partial [Mortierella sp. AD094]
MVWNIFSTPPSHISLEDAIELANEQLENAQKTKSKPGKALLLCHDAKSKIKVAERIFAAKKIGNSTQHDGIANVYHDLAQLLDELGYKDKAQKSQINAKRWGYGHTVAHQAGSSRLAAGHGPGLGPGNTTTSNAQSLSPPALTVATGVTAAMFQDALESEFAQRTHQDLIQSTNTFQIKYRIPEASETIAQAQQMIFHQDITPSIRYTLPEVGGRFTSAPQLAFCLSLLGSSLVWKDGLGEIEIEWSHAKANDPDEQERIQGVATNMVREFVRDELKKPDAVAEVICLAAVLDQVDFRKMLQAFVNGIEHSKLLDVHLIDGLAHLIRNASPGYIDTDDLVKILELLNMRLKGTHQQSTGYLYRLALTVSRVLDSMVDSQIKGLKSEQLHKHLFDYLEELQNGSDPSLIFQAAHAYQALLYIPYEETILQATLRRTGKVTQGISGGLRAVKSLDLIQFIDELRSIQRELEVAYSATMLVRDDARILAGSRKGFKDCLNEGLSFTRKSAWYPALGGLDALLQEGRLVEFEKLVREAPCRHEAAFQWGLCQRLSEMATNTLWDANTRQCAISFLGELYKDDARWRLQADVKNWILYILTRLIEYSDVVIAGCSRELLQDLEANSGSEKQAIFQVGSKVYLGSYPWMVTPPLQTSPLLDCVQNKPDVETALRKLKRERLNERVGDVYISPRAKISLHAPEDFDLTSKVLEFLASDKKVLLLLGDSGAGKSTFNRAFEINLWDKYKADERIPLFIHLPTIDKPEQGLVTKVLRKIGFSDDQIRELKAYREFVLICDGYDESQLTRNLYTSNQLNQRGEWRAQMVISCRTEYNGVNYKNRFQPTDRNISRDSELFQKAVIAPFNRDQIHDYIDQYVSSIKPPWKSEDYQQALKEIPNLQDLVKNPYLLRLALDVLPTIVDTRKSYSATQITRVGLYDKFMAQWLERSEIRFGEMNLSSRDNDAFKILSDSDFKQHGITYLKELATAIYENQYGNPVISYSEHRDRATWKEAFFNKRDEKNLMREAIPLVRNGDQYQFIHKSVLEYGFTLAVFDPNAQEYTETNSAFPSSETSALVDISMSVNVLPLLDSPLGRKDLVGEPSILQFLAERAKEQHVFKQQLHSVIQQSKTDPTVAVAAANAITVLVKAGVQFNGADLRGIKIPGADLSYGVFDLAHLEGSDLSNVNLRNVWLREANLDGARMTGVRFGELPFLQDSSSVLSFSYSPDGNSFAAGLFNGEISLYGTSNWEKIGTLSGHGNQVMSVGYSPRGDQIASGSNDKTVRLWNAESGQCIHTLQGHSKRVTWVSYSPVGSQVASGSWDETVRLWDVETGNCIQILQGHSKVVASIMYSRNGDQVASGSWDSTVRLWDVETGICNQILQGHSDQVNSIAYSPNGDQIASGSRDKTVRLWDVETGRCIRIFPGHISDVNAVIYSPKGDQIASGSSDKTVRLWDAETGICIHTLQDHSSAVTSLAYSPKGDQIASGSEDWTVRLREVGTGNYVHASRGHVGGITSVMHLPKGGQIASGSNDETVRLWDLETGNCDHTLQGTHWGIFGIAHSPRGDQIAYGSHDNTAWLWDVATGSCSRALKGSIKRPAGIRSPFKISDVIADFNNPLSTHLEGVLRINSVAYSPNGVQIACGGDDKTVRLWNVETGNCIHTLQGHSKKVTKVIYSPKGDQIASGDDDGTILLWDTRTGNCTHTLKGHSHNITNVVYSPKGHRIASGSHDKTVRLWDTKTGECIHNLQGHGLWVTSISYSAKEDWIASGSWDNTVRLWNTGSGGCTHTLQGHSDGIASIVSSQKGDWIASGSYDGTVRLWNIETGQSLLTISGFNGPVTCIAWEGPPSDQFLVTGSEDKSVRRWQIIKDGDEHRALLSWSSSHDALTVSGATFSNIQGLSKVNQMLLSQRGASGLPSLPL